MKTVKKETIIEFEEKNDKTKNSLDNLELKNEQKADILKYDRDFKREVRKLKEKFMSEEEFSKEFERLRAERNEKIRSILTEEQKKAVDNF